MLQRYARLVIAAPDQKMQSHTSAAWPRHCTIHTESHKENQERLKRLDRFRFNLMAMGLLLLQLSEILLTVCILPSEVLN
jgi:hypothetical protein